jgi:mRNA interferase RelE/StbE
MSYSVEYEPEAIASFKKIGSTDRNRILTKINWLAENFEEISPQPLTADLSGFYKLRVGDYRVIYEFNVEARILFIDQIGHRSEIYDG